GEAKARDEADDDDDDENTLSIAAMERVLMPIVLQTLDDIGDVHAKIRRLRDQRLVTAREGKLPSPARDKRYAEAKLPWFDLYDENAATLEARSRLAGVKGTAELDAEKSTQPLVDDDPVNAGPLKKLWVKVKTGMVRDGDW
ncbi:MAG: hypothetical protein IH786_12670, partial [Proteobacteria bacterium]|nr:hypothetical protein [Pseudomonadota bacterium]